MKEGKRVEKFSEKIQSLKESLADHNDLEQVGILHELIDDTPYKTKNYMRYVHDEYHIVHNKPHIIERAKKVYTLQNTEKEIDENLFSLIKNRVSTRDYLNKTISFEDFSNIIHYSFGIKSVGRGAYDQKEFPFRYINSQGGLNYLDLYVFVSNVESIEQGLYYYDFINNKLCQIDYGNFRYSINEIHFQNEFAVYGNFTCLLVADLSRVVPKYYKRSYRMAHVDAGIALAYMQLISEYHSIASCIIAGYLEHIIEDMIDLTEDEYPIATICFGYESDWANDV